MDDLFSKLWSLKLKSANRPFEDYLTEIFAQCLRSSSSFLDEFLESLNIKRKDSFFNIKTQETFRKLKGHDQDSRPDIVIYLTGFTVFIENKVGAQEGVGQLQRYAEQLCQMGGEKVLVYITRDYDKKKKEVLLEKCDPEKEKTVDFDQFRWYEIHQLAKRHQANHLINELIKFMEQTGLSTNNRFSPLDILSLTNFSRVKKMMDETMHGVVSEKFIEATGGISQDASSMTQIKNHDRYIYYKNKKNKIWIGLGYWLNAFNNEEYPGLSFCVEVAPSSAKYDEIKTIMRAIVARESDWYGYNLEVEKSWSNIGYSSNLKAFLTKDNHIQAIQDFFLKAIASYQEIEKEFGELI